MNAYIFLTFLGKYGKKVRKVRPSVTFLHYKDKGFGSDLSKVTSNNKIPSFNTC